MVKRVTFQWADGTYITLSDLHLMWEAELADTDNKEDFLKEIETLEDYINYQRIYGELIISEVES